MFDFKVAPRLSLPMHRWLYLMGSCLGLLTAPATAQDRPTLGLIYNTRENHSIRYGCEYADRELTCSLVQTAIRHKLSPAETAAKLKEARSQYQSFRSNLTRECDGVAALHDALVLGKLPPGSDPAAIEKMRNQSTKKQLDDQTKLVKAWQTACNQPSESNYLAFMGLNVEREARTCLVSTTPFSQKFRQVEINGPWVVVDKPSGPCGVVNLSRFQSESGASGGTFWQYVAKKAVTNPKGEFAPGGSCSRLDEASYLYDWRRREVQLSCDYIEFSVF